MCSCALPCWAYSLAPWHPDLRISGLPCFLSHLFTLSSHLIHFLLARWLLFLWILDLWLLILLFRLGSVVLPPTLLRDFRGLL